MCLIKKSPYTQFTVQFTVKVGITHIWEKDTYILWYTYIKTLAYAVWHSQQRLLSEGESEFWEVYKLTTSQLLTLLF